MLDTTLNRSPARERRPGAGAQSSTQALLAGWREGLAIVSLRGDPDDAGFREAVRNALGVALPTPGASVCGETLRIVWAGPDDWFVIGPRGQADLLAQGLRAALAGSHAAVTDVSSGYTVLSLCGAPVRDVLAEGCPLDLHSRSFRIGQAAGTHFFKASLWLWQTDAAPTYELLVRRSFRDYVWLMLERCSAECGLITRRLAS